MQQEIVRFLYDVLQYFIQYPLWGLLKGFLYAKNFYFFYTMTLFRFVGIKSIEFISLFLQQRLIQNEKRIV